MECEPVDDMPLALAVVVEDGPLGTAVSGVWFSAWQWYAFQVPDSGMHFKSGMHRCILARCIFLGIGIKR